MRILVIHNRYRSAAPSGENRVVDQESAALKALGHEVERFEYQSDDIDGWSAARKATLPARVVWNPAAPRDLAAVLRRFAPDVAHVHNTFPLLSPAVLHACRDAGVPVVATLHNYKLLCASGDFFRDGAVCHDCADGSVLPALRHGCYRGSAAATVPVIASNVVHRRSWRGLVSAYIFISAAQRRLMAGLRVSPDRAFVKPNFVPYVEPRDVPKRRQVAYVGRLDAAKGVPLLLAGWDRYRAEAGDDALRLVIAGDGPLGPEVRRWAEARPSVEMVGHLSRTECGDVLTASRAAVLPSQWEETFGLVVVEAMAAGTPVVAAAHGSFTELVADGRDGVLFRPGDPADLARAIGAVDRDPERFAALGREARHTYERRFDVAANVDQLLDIYRFAVRNPARLAA